jgi:hypothetical protein
MESTTLRSSQPSSTFKNVEVKEVLWKQEYIIDNLPPWIYTDNPEPTSISECQAKLSALSFTLQDIDMQIEIRDLEQRIGLSRHNSSYDFEKWKVQALKARQTHLYLQNAYTYWLLLNDRKETTAANELESKLKAVMQILIEDGPDFVDQLKELL